MNMQKICVFCGSSPGLKPAYAEAAQALGRILADKQIGLVYGGGSVGMMGQVADAVIAKGGQVVGVVPQSIAEKEVAHTGLSDLRVVHSMHERKALMADLSDGFIALPGGLGTLEEFVEILTWLQLGIHHKPCGLLNVSQYWEKFTGFLDHIVEQQFMQPEHRAMVLMDEDPQALIAKLEDFRPPKVDKAAWALKLNNR